MALSVRSLVSAVVLIFSLAACGGSGGDNSAPLQQDPLSITPPTSGVEPQGPIGRVVVDGTVGEFFTGSPPATVGSVQVGRPSNVEPASSIISGGSIALVLNGDREFSTVYLMSGDEGYFSIQLPEATQSASMIVTSSDTLEGGTDLALTVQVETPTGDVSEALLLNLSTVQVGTGDVQVSVSWDSATDVDIYLVEPSGREISFLNGLSDTGGMLDLDSNPDCEIDGFNNENITYEGGNPALGEYIAGVRYYSNCGVQVPTNFVVTLQRNGITETYSGQLVPEDSANAISVEVVRFMVE